MGMYVLLQVKITARDMASLEKSKAIISNLTMVPIVGDVYRYGNEWLALIYYVSFYRIMYLILCWLVIRNCKITSIVPYGAFVEIVPGREVV